MKGNYIEAVGHLGMSLVRGNQLAGQAQMLQLKLKLESAIKVARGTQAKSILLKRVDNTSSEALSDRTALSSNESTKNDVEYSNLLDRARSENNKDLIDVLVKYGNNPDKIPALHYAIKCHDFEQGLLIKKI